MSINNFKGFILQGDKKEHSDLHMIIKHKFKKCIPTVALPPSGVRVEIPNFLSACGQPDEILRRLKQAPRAIW